MTTGREHLRLAMNDLLAVIPEVSELVGGEAGETLLSFRERVTPPLFIVEIPLVFAIRARKEYDAEYIAQSFALADLNELAKAFVADGAARVGRTITRPPDMNDPILCGHNLFGHCGNPSFTDESADYVDDDTCETCGESRDDCDGWCSICEEYTHDDCSCCHNCERVECQCCSVCDSYDREECGCCDDCNRIRDECSRCSACDRHTESLWSGYRVCTCDRCPVCERLEDHPYDSSEECECDRCDSCGLLDTDYIVDRHGRGYLREVERDYPNLICSCGEDEEEKPHAELVTHGSR